MPSAMTARDWSPTRSTGRPRSTVAQGLAVPKRSPGATSQRMGTDPERPSTRKASSLQGRRPAEPTLSAAVTRTTPDAVRYVVSRTLVSST